MVKKCLIAIAVVALLATTVRAGDTYPSIKKDPLEGLWPWKKVYDALPICTFNVKLEVGHYVQIYKCNKLEMLLEQVDCADIGKGGKFPCYSDCVDIKVRANFPATLGATFDGSAGDYDIISDDKKSFWWGADDDTIVGDGGWEDLKLCMKAWEVKLWETDGKIDGWAKVGKITLTVKPQNETGP